MAIALDAFSNGLCTGFNTGTGVMTLGNFTTGAGANRLLLILAVVKTSNTTGAAFSNVTYNGVAVTGTIFSVVQTNKFHSGAFYVTAPTSGSHAVTCTFTNGNVSGSEVQVFCISFTGVNQTTPIASNTNGAENGANTTNYPTNFNMPISGGVYGVQFGGIVYNNFDGPSTTPTPFTTTDANNTSLIGSGGAGIPGHIVECAHGSYSGASTNVTWKANQTAAYDYIIGAISLNQPASTTTFTWVPPSMVETVISNPKTLTHPFTLAYALAISAWAKKTTHLWDKPAQWTITVPQWPTRIIKNVMIGLTSFFSSPPRRRRFIWPPRSKIL